jgi:hypothetical protein
MALNNKLDKKIDEIKGLLYIIPIGYLSLFSIFAIWNRKCALSSPLTLTTPLFVSRNKGPIFKRPIFPCELYVKLFYKKIIFMLTK